MIRYVTIDKFSELTGYTSGAIRRKIGRGVWDFFIKCSDGRILMDTEGFNLWVENDTRALEKLARQRLR